MNILMVLAVTFVNPISKQDQAVHSLMVADIDSCKHAANQILNATKTQVDYIIKGYYKCVDLKADKVLARETF